MSTEGCIQRKPREKMATMKSQSWRKTLYEVCKKDQACMELGFNCVNFDLKNPMAFAGTEAKKSRHPSKKFFTEQMDCNNVETELKDRCEGAFEVVMNAKKEADKSGDKIVREVVDDRDIKNGLRQCLDATKGAKENCKQANKVMN